jgi:hypothetical protein
MDQQEDTFKNLPQGIIGSMVVTKSEEIIQGSEQRRQYFVDTVMPHLKKAAEAAACQDMQMVVGAIVCPDEICTMVVGPEDHLHPSVTVAAAILDSKQYKNMYKLAIAHAKATGRLAEFANMLLES